MQKQNKKKTLKDHSPVKILMINFKSKQIYKVHNWLDNVKGFQKLAKVDF